MPRQPMMLTCKNVCENSTELIERKSGLWARFMFRVHLMMCKHCRRFVRQLEATMGVTRRVDQADEPSDEEIDRIVERLKQQ